MIWIKPARQWTGVWDALGGGGGWLSGPRLLIQINQAAECVG